LWEGRPWPDLCRGEDAASTDETREGHNLTGVRMMNQPLRLTGMIALMVGMLMWLGGCGGGNHEAVTALTSSPSAVRTTTQYAAEVVPANGGCLPGDMDGDGKASVGDAIKILRIVVGLDDNVPCADANESGSTDVGDAILVLRCVVGLDPWPIGGTGATTVYVVDNPPTGSHDHFRELTDAIDYLKNNVPVGELGTVVIQTNRELVVDSLSFPCDLKIEVDQGYTGRIAGPGAKPLEINAAGALNLGGFTISNAGGVIFNANRRIELSGNHLPSSAAVNIGGVSGAAFPAGSPSAGITSQQAGRASGSSITNNDFGQFALNYKLDVLSASYEIDNNKGSKVNIGGSGKFGGTAQMHIGGNDIDDLSLDLKAAGSATVAVTQHASLDNLSVNSEVNAGSPVFDFKSNVAAAATLNLFGLGKVTLKLDNEDYDNLDLGFSVSDSILQSKYGKYAQAAVTLGSALTTFNWNDLGSNAMGPFTFNALNIPNTANVEVTLKSFKFDGTFDAALNGNVTLDLSEQVKLTGKAHIDMRGSVLHLEASHVNCEAGLFVEMKGLSAGITANMNNVTFKDSLSINGATGVNFSVTITDAIFGGSSAGIYISGPVSGSMSAQGGAGPQSYAASVVKPQQGGGGINISGLQMNSDGDWIEITDVNCPVTIENCTIAAKPLGIHLEEVQGAITIDKNTITGGGVTIGDCGSATVKDNTINCDVANTGALGVWATDSTITGNTITAGPGSEGFSATSSSNVTLSNNTINAPGTFGAVDIGPDARVNADNNKITGSVFVVFGLLGLTNNTFSNTQLLDESIGKGGLLNDPMQGGNSGLIPDNIWSPIDWDGNGCQDYPPGCNQKVDGNCKCGQPGVSPPG